MKRDHQCNAAVCRDQRLRNRRKIQPNYEISDFAIRQLNFTLPHQATGLDTQSCSTIYRNFISHTTFEFLIIFQMRRYRKNSNK